MAISPLDVRAGDRVNALGRRGGRDGVAARSDGDGVVVAVRLCQLEGIIRLVGGRRRILAHIACAGAGNGDGVGLGVAVTTISPVTFLMVKLPSPLFVTVVVSAAHRGRHVIAAVVVAVGLEGVIRACGSARRAGEAPRAA